MASHRMFYGRKMITVLLIKGLARKLGGQNWQMYDFVASYLSRETTIYSDSDQIGIIFSCNVRNNVEVGKIQLYACNRYLKKFSQNFVDVLRGDF